LLNREDGIHPDERQALGDHDELFPKAMLHWEYFGLARAAP
jgi:hypothetical protein